MAFSFHKHNFPKEKRRPWEREKKEFFILYAAPKSLANHEESFENRLLNILLRDVNITESGVFFFVFLKVSWGW